MKSRANGNLRELFKDRDLIGVDRTVLAEGGG